MSAVLYGLLVLSEDIAARKLLLSAVIAGSLGVAAAYLGAGPKALLGRPGTPLALLYVVGALRLSAASCVGFSPAASTRRR